MKKFLTLLTLFLTSIANAQSIDTLAFQDFETAPASPVWTFTGPVIYNSGFTGTNAAPASSPIGIGGSRAWETTTNSGGLQLDFANIIIPAGYDSVRIRFNLAAMNLISTGGGPDNLDYFLTAVSLDNGVSYYNRLRIRGAVNDNSYWPYSATGVAKVYYQPQSEALFQPLNTGPQTTMGYSTCEIVFPGNVAQIKLRMTGRSSSSTDTWLVDNLVLTGESSCVNTTSSISPVACGSYLSPAGNTYTSSANFTETIQNAAGCDSVITISLTVNNATTSFINPVVCNTYLSPAGNTYTSSANFTETIQNSTGCDSVITISLTVNNATAASISPVVCGSYLSPAGNLYNSSSNFTETIQNSAGCDSVITINLTVNHVDTSVSINGALLTSNASGAQYQWLDCDNGGIPINGATSQSFMPLYNGGYAVIVTDSNCTDTSSCVQVLTTGMNVTDAIVAFTVSPNPAGDFFILTTTQALKHATLTLTDVQGRTISSVANQSGNTFRFDMKAMGNGMYILQVLEENNVRSIRVMKN